MNDEAAAVYLRPDELVPWDRNPRHNEAAVDAIAASIREFGFASPIVARVSDRRIIAGHTRWLAACRLGLERVPVRLVDLDDEKAAALSIADNRTGELATWDEGRLAELVKELDGGGLDLALLGFQREELDVLLGRFVDPFAPDDRNQAGEGDAPEIVDTGTSRITVTVPVTDAHDASDVIRTSMDAAGFKDYKLVIV